MRTLRSAYNKAIALGVADLALYPFHNLQNPNGYKISELETTTPKRAIKLEDIISEAMGHPDEKTTQIYLEDFENSVLDEANRKLL